MTLVYYILTVITSSIATLIIPDMVVRYRHYKTRKQQQLRTLIATEVAKQLKDIIND